MVQDERGGMPETEYDIALSFAGEDRGYVDQVANHLRRAGVRVFYDRYEQVGLWGKDLYEHLSDVYRKRARFTVMFISGHYAAKVWPRHERRNAQARALHENREYILPARFDDTEVPGLPDTIHYLELSEFTPAQLAEAICEKLVDAGITLAAPVPSPTAVESPPVSAHAVTVTVKGSEGEPVQLARVLLVAANGMHTSVFTNVDGQARVEMKKRRLLTVFFAHPNYPAFVVNEFDPIHDLTATIPTAAGAGSLISTGGWDRIPGLEGMMNPIHDSSGRLYLYAPDIAVNGGEAEPVRFEIGGPLHFEDVEGVTKLVTFAAVVKRCFLVEFRPA